LMEEVLRRENLLAALTRISHGRRCIGPRNLR
jgi:hypothetical protein